MGINRVFVFKITENISTRIFFFYFFFAPPKFLIFIFEQEFNGVGIAELKCYFCNQH